MGQLGLTLVMLSVLISLLSYYYACKHSSSTITTATTTLIKLTEELEDSIKTPSMAASPPPSSEISSTTTTVSTISTTASGVKIEKNPSESKLTQLGVSSWPKWGCSPSKFPWTFTATETMYLLEGKVKVYCDGYDGFFEIGAGDLVEFPKGMKVTWDVTEAVKKHYSLEE